MSKFDLELAKVISLNNQQNKINCLAYYNDKQKASKYFFDSNINILADFPFISALAIEIESDKILPLSKMDFITYLSSNSKVTALVNVAKKIMGIDKTIFDGSGIGVAIIDTGIAPHLDLVLGKNRIIKFVDLVNSSNPDNKDFISKNSKVNFNNLPYDDNGHGTFVCGVACGSGLVSNGKFSGFAKNSNIIGIKALDSRGEANVIKILEAMQWVYDNANIYNIKVVCMSFGSESLGYGDPIMKGADMLWQKGIILVAAAGNSGPKSGTIKSPGVSPKIITVGGFNDNRINESFNPNFFEVANFSSRGPALNHIKPDVVAPAVDITSLDKKGGYTTLSGTSVATPMVAGLCALLVQKFPNYSPNQIKKIIMSNTIPISYERNAEGRGRCYFK